MKTNQINMKIIPSKLFRILISCFILSFVLSPTLAHAYVDPGSGSVIVTTILGIIAAIGYTFRKYFYKIKRMIFGRKMEKSQAQEE